MEKELFRQFVTGWIFLACIVFVILLFVTAPYGRHSSAKWGLTFSNRMGWIIMELSALIAFSFFYLSGHAPKTIATWVIYGLFALHYINRSVVYPLRIKTRGKQMPVLIAVMAICFNGVNGFLNGYYLGSLQTGYPGSWLLDIRFITGILIFFTGMIINIKADNILIRLRKSSTNGYLIPRGGLFNKISCPNFFGEMVEWTGFAILCWSLPAISFLVWTICNLLPRALDHHKWYRMHFTDYPGERKAVIPGIL